ncbi:MAG: tetratricopeptide repeat protein [Bacteroidales bacterium]|jgi:tetratricopeptide (TPR) repeat protein
MKKQSVILKFIFLILVLLQSNTMFSQFDILAFESYNEGVSHLISHEYDSAVICFTNTIKLKPDLAASYYNLAYAYFSKQDFTNALYSIDNYVIRSKGDSMFYFKGLCLEYNNLKDSAIFCYKKSIDNLENVQQSLSRLVSIYYEKGLYDTALIHSNRLISFFPNNGKAYFNRGRTYIKLNEIKLAISDFLKSIEFLGDNYQSYYELGNCYFLLNDYKRAIEYLNTAAELNPKSVVTYNLLGLSHIQTENYIESLKIFTKGIKSDESYLELYNNRGVALFHLGSYDNALEDFDYVISKQPDNAQTLFNRAKVKEKMFDLKGACEDLNKCYNLGLKEAESLLKFCN